MSKTLVVFFSRGDEEYNVGTVEVGNTTMMAGHIADYLKNAGQEVESFQVVPEQKYPTDYASAIEVSKKELSENTRPAYKGEVENWDEYEKIFLGYPIWWGDLPMPLYTFIERHDWAGKKVVPFNTHEGSGSAGTYVSLAEKLSGAEVEQRGLALSGKKARTEEGRQQVEAWLKELI